MKESHLSYNGLGEFFMNKNLKIFGLLTLLCFSFYYTNQIAKWMQQKDPIYESIIASANDYKVESMNAIINEDTIIPGLMGMSVNVEKSFRSMKNEGYFSVNHLVFDEIKPEISLEENKDKVILQGNDSKNGVSLIIESPLHREYLEEMGISYALLVTKDTMTNHLEYGLKINSDMKNYEEVENYLTRNKESSSFCVASKKEEEICKQKKKITIRKTEAIQNSNFINNYNQMSSGKILFIDSNLSISHFKILLNQIYFRGLQIMSLEELLSEARS